VSGAEVAALAVGLAALVSAGLLVFVCVRLMQSLDHVLAIGAAERERHRVELEGLFNRVQHPRVYQPTAEQERTIRTAREPARDEFERAGRIFNFEPADDVPGPQGETG
jgi:hypothetical protein